MAKIQSTPNNRKLTASTFEGCADSLRKKCPTLSGIMHNEKELHLLEQFVTIVKQSRRLQMLEKYLAAQIITPHTFEEMKLPRLSCRTEGVASRCIEAEHPPGTLAWMFEVFPDMDGNFCEFLLDALEIKEMIRDLTAGYNYIGIDPEDMNDILARSNDACKKLNLFAGYNEQRLRVLAKLGHTNKTRKLKPETDMQVA